MKGRAAQERRFRIYLESDGEQCQHNHDENGSHGPRLSDLNTAEYRRPDSEKPTGASLPGRLSDTGQHRKRILRAGRRQGFALQWRHAQDPFIREKSYNEKARLKGRAVSLVCLGIGNMGQVNKNLPCVCSIVNTWSRKFSSRSDARLAEERFSGSRRTLPNRARELAPSAVAKHRIHHEAAARADRGCRRAGRWLIAAGNGVSMNLFRCHAGASSSRSKTPGKYITKLPKNEHEAAEWQAAMEGADPGGDIGRPDNVCSHWHHGGIEPARRAGV
jgi:hypothetical protein